MKLYLNQPKAKPLHEVIEAAEALLEEHYPHNNFDLKLSAIEDVEDGAFREYCFDFTHKIEYSQSIKVEEKSDEQMRAEIEVCKVSNKPLTKEQLLFENLELRSELKKESKRADYNMNVSKVILFGVVVILNIVVLMGYKL